MNDEPTLAEKYPPLRVQSYASVEILNETTTLHEHRQT